MSDAKWIPTPPHDWEHPRWEDAGKVHEWKNYVSDELADMWQTFTSAQKQAIARNAAEQASNELWD
jgi:hypothetical protein